MFRLEYDCDGRQGKMLFERASHATNELLDRLVRNIVFAPHRAARFHLTYLPEAGSSPEELAERERREDDRDEKI